MRASKRFFLRAVFCIAIPVLAWFAVPPTAARQAESTPKKHKAPISSYLVFDATTKTYEAKVGESNAPFQFNITNAWSNAITVDRIETSCGCTAATMPSNPWHLGPGEYGAITATVNIAGKGAGLTTKLVTLYLSANGDFIGTRVATLKINIPEQPSQAPEAGLSEADRKAAMSQAKADPRAIFTDAKCAKCHADRALKAATGPEIYKADCGICHDSPNRATFVPDLHALKVPTNLDYWTAMITYGKTNTLMPAFASFKGGPLNENQVRVLANYLASGDFARATTNAAAKLPAATSAEQ
jgi:mono/diheme cytochrome c family protein